MTIAHELTGQRFGRLVVLRLDTTAPSGSGCSRRWLCRCDCGTETSVRSSNLIGRATVSCGCVRRERARTQFRRRMGIRADARSDIDPDWDELQL